MISAHEERAGYLWDPHHESLEARLTTKIQQHANSPACGFQVVHDLRLRIVLDRGGSLDFHEDNARNDDVGIESADQPLSESHSY